MKSPLKPGKFDPNDPKLTAYALGETAGLTRQEAEQMKQLIDQDPEAKAFVEEVRQTAQLVSHELGQEKFPRLAVEEREALLAKANSVPRKTAGWRFFLKPRFTLTFGTLAALALLFVIARPVLHDRMSKVSSAIDGFQPEAQLAQSPPTSADSAPSTPPTIERKKARAAGEVAGLAPESPTEKGYEFKEEAPAAELQSAQSTQSAKTGVGASAGYGGASAVTGNVGQPAAQMDLEVDGSRAEGAPPPAKPFGKIKKIKTNMKLLRAPIAGDPQASSTASYAHIVDNGFKKTGDEPLSTFSTDVDTASYSNMRRFLVSSQLPPADSIRLEELVNYFPYDYAPPTNGKPFAVHTEISSAPWNPRHKLVKIGIKGKESTAAARPASNFVFLIDVSGSMFPQERLPLIQKSLKLLVEKLREQDRVALVVYAGTTGVVLDSTPGTKRLEIANAIDRLKAGGSTNGAAGIKQAYEIATKHFIKGGINRVILATDGDFNVGTTSEGELVRLIEEKAKSGVSLTTLGVGTDNFKDSMMQKLADKGNGNYFYLDSIREARKVLVKQAGGTLNTIAKDVKIQVEFNPKYAASYRLIGYEKRLLNKEDFNDDTKDAGDIGEGHTVTALYEVVPPGIDGAGGTVDALKYVPPQPQKTDGVAPGVANGELLTVKLRYKKPEGSDASELIEVPVKDEAKSFEQASTDLKFASAVAGFGMILRDSKFKGDFTLQQAQEIASKSATFRGEPDEYRKELVELIKKTRSLKGQGSASDR